MSEILFNPFDPAFRANPYPFYDTLRAQDPVHQTALGMVVLTRYEDVSATLKSNDYSRDIEKYSPQASSEARQRRRERNTNRTKSILNLDPPDHTRLRRLVSKSFTPSAIERLREWSQSITASLEPTASDDELASSDAAIDLLVPYLTEIIEHRRKHLADDMLSSLILVEESGERMTTDELMAFVVLLYIAGHETTVNHSWQRHLGSAAQPGATRRRTR